MSKRETQVVIATTGRGAERRTVARCRRCRWAATSDRPGEVWAKIRRHLRGHRKEVTA